MNIIKEWNGKTIRFRESDQYGCLTDMAKATGKKVAHWLENKTTQEYLSALSESIGIPIDQLVDINESSGSNEDRGTFAERKVCLRFSQWCDPNLAVQVDIWIEELLLNGSVSIKSLTPTEALLQTVQALVETERRQKELEQRQLVLEQSNQETKTIALEARDGLAQVRDQLASLKEFAVAQPPGLNQDLADQINQAFQLLGATLLEAGITNDKYKAYSTPWRDLGLTMRNSTINYDLNARYSNACKQYELALEKWKADGKPRGSKPKKPSRIALMLKDNVLTEGFRAAQQVVSNTLSKLTR